MPSAAGRQGGASSVEVYGFAGYVTSAVVAAGYAAWALLPEHTLQQLGITYYPSKHWALTLPTLLVLLVLYAYWTYEGLNMTRVRPPQHPTHLCDPGSPWPWRVGLAAAAPAPPAEGAIPPLVQLPPSEVCRTLYLKQLQPNHTHTGRLQPAAPPGRE